LRQGRPDVGRPARPRLARAMGGRGCAQPVRPRRQRRARAPPETTPALAVGSKAVPTRGSPRVRALTCIVTTGSVNPDRPDPGSSAPRAARGPCWERRVAAPSGPTKCDAHEVAVAAEEVEAYRRITAGDRGVRDRPCSQSPGGPWRSAPVRLANPAHLRARCG